MKEKAECQGIDKFLREIESIPKKMFSVAELSEITGLEKAFFYNAHKLQMIACLKFGNQIRFLKSDVVDWVKSCSNPKKKGDLYERR